MMTKSGSTCLFTFCIARARTGSLAGAADTLLEVFTNLTPLIIFMRVVRAGDHASG